MLVLLALALLGTAVASTLWFSLLRRRELNRLNTFTFLTPAFGLLIGALFFGERLQGLEIVGIVLILVGVAWISRGAPDSPQAKVTYPQKMRVCGVPDCACRRKSGAAPASRGAGSVRTSTVLS